LVKLASALASPASFCTCPEAISTRNTKVLMIKSCASLQAVQVERQCKLFVGVKNIIPDNGDRVQSALKQNQRRKF